MVARRLDEDHPPGMLPSLVCGFRPCLTLLVNRGMVGKGGTVLRMVSGAGTGHTFHMRWNLANSNEKVQLMSHDPVVNTHVLFTSTRKGVSSAGQRPKRKLVRKFNSPVGVRASQRHRVGKT